MANTYTANADPHFKSDHNSYEPARQAIVITPSDTTDLAIYAKSIYCGTSGNISLVPIEAYITASAANAAPTPVLFTVVAGTTLHVQTARVFATGTTVNNIVALWN